MMWQMQLLLRYGPKLQPISRLERFQAPQHGGPNKGGNLEFLIVLDIRPPWTDS